MAVVVLASSNDVLTSSARLVQCEQCAQQRGGHAALREHKVSKTAYEQNPSHGYEVYVPSEQRVRYYSGEICVRVVSSHRLPV